MLNTAIDYAIALRRDEWADRRSSSDCVAIRAAQPTVSVVMPVHCGADWLAATLESLAAEADEECEVILIDSSPDRLSIDIASRFADRLDLTIIWRPDMVSWIGKTNLAVTLAKGAHVAMLHQDDLWLPGRMATVRRWIAADPAAALHLAPTRIVDADTHNLGDWRCPLATGPIDRDALIERLIVQCFVSVPAPIFRRDAFLSVGGMDTELWYTGDWDLWLKLAQVGTVIYNPEVTTAFRIHGKSLTMTGSRNLAEFADQLRTVLSRHRPAIADRRVSALAEASVRINIALAAVANGRTRSLFAAIAAVARLGPLGARNYVHQSRILDRAIPRIRAKLAGAF